MTGCGQPELGGWGGQNWPIFKVPPTLSLPLLPRRSRCSRSRCGALRPSADPRAGEGPTERGLTARAAPGPEGGAGRGGGERAEHHGWGVGGWEGGRRGGEQLSAPHRPDRGGGGDGRGPARPGEAAAGRQVVPSSRRTERIAAAIRQ